MGDELMEYASVTAAARELCEKNGCVEVQGVVEKTGVPFWTAYMYLWEDGYVENDYCVFVKSDDDL